MAWIVSTKSPDMIYQEEIWQRVSSRGKIFTMRRITKWQWGHIVVDDEPSLDELNSDDGFDVEAALPIDRDFENYCYIWEPVDKRTNKLVNEIDDLDQLVDALKAIGWRLVESHTTMFGQLQKTKARRKAKQHPMLNNYDPATH